MYESVPQVEESIKIILSKQNPDEGSQGFGTVSPTWLPLLIALLETGFLKIFMFFNFYLYNNAVTRSSFVITFRNIS